MTTENNNIEENEICPYVASFVEELQSRPLTEAEGELILWYIMNAEGNQEEARQEAYEDLYYMSFDCFDGVEFSDSIGGGYTEENIFKKIEQLEAWKKQEAEEAEKQAKKDALIEKVKACYYKALADYREWEAKQYKKAYGSAEVGYEGFRMNINAINQNRRNRAMKCAISTMNDTRQHLKELGYDVETLEKYYYLING